MKIKLNINGTTIETEGEALHQILQVLRDYGSIDDDDADSIFCDVLFEEAFLSAIGL